MLHWIAHHQNPVPSKSSSNSPENSYVDRNFIEQGDKDLKLLYHALIKLILYNKFCKLFISFILLIIVTATSTPLPSISCTQTEEPEIAEKELISVSTVQNLSFSFLGPNVSVAERVAFIEKHPFQPDNKDVKNWNADTFSIYTRTLPNGEQVQRIWATVKVKNSQAISLHCSI